MIKWLTQLLCKIGLHRKKDLVFRYYDHYNEETNTLRYNACIWCGDGDPRITGEW